MQDYHKLRVWPKSFELAIAIRRAAERFPARGYAELKAQMQSAAESIYHNIMEGCGAEQPKEFARFLSIAIKSTTELQGQLDLAHGYGILADGRWQLLTTEATDTRKMLYGLRRSILAAGIEGARGKTENGTRKTQNDSDRRECTPENNDGRSAT